jgi:hypothetical protein
MSNWVPRLATIPEDLDEFIPDKNRRRRLVFQKMVTLEKVYAERMQRSVSFVQTSFSKRIPKTVNPYQLYKKILDLDASIEKLQIWLKHPVNAPFVKEFYKNSSFQKAYRFIPDYMFENEAMDRFLSKNL